MSTALVLSAGGMFGAYQAGAWKVLAPVFRPDLVVGVSAGALNGWAIAGACDPEDLLARWRDPGAAGGLRIRPRWNACLDPEPLMRIARDLVERYRPVVPFAATAVEIPAMRLRIMRGEEITWQHLVASCAIPVGFPPVRIEGQLLVDGGLLAVLPLWAASELGATRAIVLDALPSMPSRAVRAAVKVARLAARPPAVPTGLEIVRVSPAEPLGKVRDALFWRGDRIQEWILRGQRDAQRLLEYDLCRTFGSTG